MEVTIRWIGGSGLRDGRFPPILMDVVEEVVQLPQFVLFRRFSEKTRRLTRQPKESAERKAHGGPQEWVKRRRRRRSTTYG